jgi:hypothetical protein
MPRRHATEAYRGRRKNYMSNRISASLGLISMLAALACSSSPSSTETSKPSNTVGSLASALSVDGGVDAGNVDAGDAGVDAAP